MKPTRDDDAVVELVDVLLADGAVLAADVTVSVADVPLLGIRLRLLLAGMTRLTDEGVFEEWDREQRARALDGDEPAGDRAVAPASRGESNWETDAESPADSEPAGDPTDGD